jgi:hypothetical protein
VEWRIVDVGHRTLLPVIQFGYVEQVLIYTNCDFSALCVYPNKSLPDYVMNLLVSFKISPPVVLFGRLAEQKVSTVSVSSSHIAHTNFQDHSRRRFINLKKFRVEGVNFIAVMILLSFGVHL